MNRGASELTLGCGFPVFLSPETNLPAAETAGSWRGRVEQMSQVPVSDSG